MPGGIAAAVEDPFSLDRPIGDRANYLNQTALVSLLDPKSRSSLDTLVRPAVEFSDRERPSPLTWAHTQSLSIVILRPGEIARPRWDGFVRSFEQSVTTRLLLFVLGAVDVAPNQRRALTRAIGERRVAAVVDSMVGRGLVTALGWSGVSIESFPISAVREAIGALDPESDGEPIELCLDRAVRLIERADSSGVLRDRLARLSGPLA